MRARLVVFPVKGRSWCFTRSVVDSHPSSSSSSTAPATLKELWKKVSSKGASFNSNTELVVDFVSDKMNRAWSNIEKAPAGTIKKKIHSLGLKLLSRVKPTEVFLKSISKDITKVDITYPASLNPRLVRRRLRHIALRGSTIHRKNFYGAVTMLPLTTIFTVLPLPNIPFFWALFRAYSNWRALKGSERLLILVSDCSKSWASLPAVAIARAAEDKKPNLQPPWELLPSEELEVLITGWDGKGGVGSSRLVRICEAYQLVENDVVKYQNSL